MATEIKVLENLIPGQKASFARLSNQMSVCNGYDLPRYFDKTGRSGYLGLESWTGAAYQPNAALVAGGSLTAGKYYSCVAVPKDTTYSTADGEYRTGNPTDASTAISPSGANLSIRFTIPARHPQNRLDSAVAEADEVWLFCSQGADDAATAEAATKYYIGQVNNAAGQNFTLTTEPTTTVDAAPIDNFQPPRLRHTVAMNDRVFGIVGVTEARGTFRWSSVNTRFEGLTYGTFTISSIADQGNDRWRYSFSGSPDLSSVTTGMRMSATGCTNANNDVSLATIVAVSDASDYIDVINENGVAQVGAAGTTTVYATFIGDGFIGFRFRFEDDGVTQEYTIETIDTTNQRFTCTAAYTGSLAVDTYHNYTIQSSDRRLWYSKPDDPNSWPTANTISFDEDLTAVCPAGEHLAVFSRTSVYIVNPLNATYYRPTHAPTGTPAPYSAVLADDGVFYFDGKTIRKFDGANAIDITRRKIRLFLDDINESLSHLVHGVYVKSEGNIRWYFPIGTNTATLNYWVQYNVNTGFWWFGRCMDATCSTVIEEPTTGITKLYTGTSARYAPQGFINKWGDTYVDGQNATTTDIFGTVDSASGQTINFTMAAGVTVSTSDVGCPVNIIDPNGTRDVYAVIETIVSTGGTSYRITCHSDFDLSSITSGDWIILGVPAFRYGIKWFDFTTPQYKHELKEVHIQSTPGAYTFGIVDFYVDYNPTPVKSVAFTLEASETKTVVRFHGQRGYKVGYRIRAWSQGLFEIRDKVIVHRTIV